MRVGLFGLPSTGKTTVFEALSGSKINSGGKQKANRAVVKVPDARLDRLYSFYKPRKKVPATVEYLEVGGIQGKTETGLSDSLLGNLRSMDALAHVVRVFKDDTVPHVRGSVDYLRDIDDVNTELILSDLAVIENGLEKIKRYLKAGKKKELVGKQEILLKCKQILEQGQPLTQIALTDFEQELIKNYQFLTRKPMLIILNTDENQDIVRLTTKVRTTIADTSSTIVTAISGKLEMEIAQLASDEQQLFLQEIGIVEPALNRFIADSFRLLGLIVFFTVGDDEVRAWTLRNGSRAIKAAATIHTDLERGFIRAEVFHYEDLIAAQGSENQLKRMGKIRLEGKDYVVQDGDIVCIRFNINKSQKTA